jgi:hypothetical protein
MIAISTPSFDLDGHIRLREMPSTDLGHTTRRVNRAKTLDGGVAFNDGGHAEGDRTIVVHWRPGTVAEYAAAQRLVELYPELVVSTRSGVFTAVPSALKYRGREAVMTLLVRERLA